MTQWCMLVMLVQSCAHVPSFSSWQIIIIIINSNNTRLCPSAKKSLCFPVLHVIRVPDTASSYGTRGVKANILFKTYCGTLTNLTVDTPTFGIFT